MDYMNYIYQPPQAPSCTLPPWSLPYSDGCQGQFLNAISPIVTPFGNVTDFRPRQLSNALFPMLVTLDGIVTDSRPLQPKNALLPMLVTPDGIVTEVR